MNWQRLFKGHILDRGYDYFCDDAVNNLEVSEDRISATVSGTDEYEVDITMKGDKIVDMYCSCPYAEDGKKCKHMAAVLFEWEADKNLTDLEHGRDILFSKDASEMTVEVEDIIRQADEEQIREFLSYVLYNDEKLFARFKTLIEPAISKDDMERYKRQVDATIDEYLGREHYISYYKAYDFICAMEEFLYEDVRMMLDAGCYWNAFELTCYIFVEVASVDIDDSDGGTSMLAGQCMQIWEEILEHADAKTEEDIYKWFTGHLNGSIVDYMEDYLEELLMNHFKSEKYVQAKLDYVERKVSEAKQLSDSWTSNYRAAKWILRRIELMEQSGFAWNIICDYCKENWSYSDVRKHYIAKCEEQGNYDEVIKTLKDSIELDAQWHGLVINYSTKLKDIYKLHGKVEAYKQQLWNLVTKDNAGDVDDFKELKGLYSIEEWEKVREQIFESLPKYACIEELYKEEKLYDRLLECVLKAPNVYVLQKYEKDLREDYPQEILQKYADDVNKMAVRAADRKQYQYWVAILRRMTKIKGGKEKVREITEHWRTAYRNRPALMDELNKL